MADEAWLDWQKRFRDHVERTEQNWSDIADELGMSGSGLRHWMNSTRGMRLDKFFALCAAGHADPAVILFGRPLLSSELHEAIRKQAATESGKKVTS